MITIEIDGQELKIWEKAIAYSPESLAYFTPKAKREGEKSILYLTPEDIDDLLSILSLLPVESDDEEDAFANFEDLLLYSVNTSKEDTHEL